jgi:lauroyl/myristoyl acyltransferase
MGTMLYWIARAFVAALQALPLRFVARLGRCGGALAWRIDARHRKVILENLGATFPGMSPTEARAIGAENMRRIGENYASAVRTSGMDLPEALKVCEVAGLQKAPSFTGPGAPRNCIVAIGHFGNFELYANMGKLVAGLRGATTYRGLKQASMDRLLRELRERSGCLYFERRSDAAALRNALNEGGILLGLLADQHAGNGGVRGTFLGRDCSTTAAPAVLALRYDAPLFTAICYRVGLGKWRIELGDEIPTRKKGRVRSTEEITADINRAFEAAVRRDPANWFWVHKRWKVSGGRNNSLVIGSAAASSQAPR